MFESEIYTACLEVSVLQTLYALAGYNMQIAALGLFDEIVSAHYMHCVKGVP